MKMYQIGEIEIKADDIDHLKFRIMNGEIDVSGDRGCEKTLHRILRGKRVEIRCDGEVIGVFSS